MMIVDAIILCTRVGGHRTVDGSPWIDGVIRPCEWCRHGVTITHASFRRARELGAVPICIQCFLDRPQFVASFVATVQPPTADQRDEIAAVILTRARGTGRA